MKVSFNQGVLAGAEAARNLNFAQASFERSLGRLSSGKRIVNTSDDAAGAGMSLRLAAALNRNNVIQKNLENAKKYKEVQDSSLKELGDVITRLMELKIMSHDATKREADIANYALEYSALCSQARGISERKFNGLPLFSQTQNDQVLYVGASENGAQRIALEVPSLRTKILTDVICDKTFTVVNTTSTKTDQAGQAQPNDYEWQAAAVDALQKGGRLARFSEPTDWEQAVFQLGNPPFQDPLWIGLRQNDFAPGTNQGWFWTDGKTGATPVDSHPNWAAGQPDSSKTEPVRSSTPDASVLVFNQPKGVCDVFGHTGDEDPNDPTGMVKGYILQKTSLGVTTYSVVNASLTWDAARQDAYAKGGKLATPTTQAEFDAMKTQLRSQNVGVNDVLWMGGYQQNSSVSESDPTAGWHWVGDTLSATTHPSPTSVTASKLVSSLDLGAATVYDGINPVEVTSITGVDQGMEVSGANIPANTVISNLNPGSPPSITLSSAPSTGKPKQAVNLNSALDPNSFDIDVADISTLSTGMLVLPQGDIDSGTFINSIVPGSGNSGTVTLSKKPLSNNTPSLEAVEGVSTTLTAKTKVIEVDTDLSWAIGKKISGTGIPPNTRVVSCAPGAITGKWNITLSNYPDQNVLSPSTLSVEGDNVIDAFGGFIINGGGDGDGDDPYEYLEWWEVYTPELGVNGGFLSPHPDQPDNQPSTVANERYAYIDSNGKWHAHTETPMASDGNTLVVKGYLMEQNTMVSVTLGKLEKSLQWVATHRANGGAEISRLDFALDGSRTFQVEAEAALGRIQDTDIAAESTRLNKAKVLIEAANAALNQANSTTQTILKLISDANSRS